MSEYKPIKQIQIVGYRGLMIVTLLTLLHLLVTGIKAQQVGNMGDNVSISVDINQVRGAMSPLWAFFGYDESNFTYMKDGKKLISELLDLSKVPVFFRGHNLLNTDDGPRAALKWGSTNVYTEDEQGNPVYDWTIVDKIFDTYVERGAKPLVEIANMPRALSSKPDPYRRYWKPNDNSETIYGYYRPPADYEKWAELVYQWVLHSVERYGKEEVETWYWELWNEPNHYSHWPADTEEFIKFYDYTADAVKRALPTARVGGPEVTRPGLDDVAQFLTDFLDHVTSGKNYATGKTGTPIDFITFHSKGLPSLVDGTVRMDMGIQLFHIDEGFKIISSYPGLRNLPIILGESDPEGCAACSVEFYPQNNYRNGTMYSSYTAASLARIYKLADSRKVNLQGVLTWAFEFENEPWFAGFRTLATHGVDKPILNLFRMYGMMEGDRVAVSQDMPLTASKIMDQGVHGNRSDISALASRQGNSVSVMVWNYYDDNVSAPDAHVALNIKGVPAERVLLHHYRIDADHSNAYTVWREMGTPQQVTQKQYQILEEAGQLDLLTSPEWVDVSSDEELPLQFSLPRQGVSLLQITW